MKENLVENTKLETDELYTLSREEIIKRLESDSEMGLSSTAAEQRQKIYGKNELEAEEMVPLWKKFVEQFKDVMILVLIVAAIISGAMGEVIDAALIIAIVIINAVLGVYQEGKAEKAIEALQKWQLLKLESCAMANKP